MSDFLGGSGGGGDVAAHEAAADPHPGYRLESDTTVSRPNETLTNSTTSDQDFTSIFTIPANYLVAGKVVQVFIGLQYVTDGSASTIVFYLKLGTTKVAAHGALTPSNSVTRNQGLLFTIFGTAAAGASVNVDTFPGGMAWFFNSNNSLNNVAQPVALATNGNLNIVPGLTYGTGTGGESLTLLDTIVVKSN